MERVLQSIKWSLIALFVLALAWAALATTKWLPRPTDTQRKALAILEAPSATAIGQRNAFAAIWLWQYDIPAADLEKVAEVDIANYRIPDLASRQGFVSSAEARYHRLPSVRNETAALCLPDNDCLAKVRRDPDATRNVLQSHAVLLDHTLALSAYDYYHDRFPPNLLAPVPDMSGPGWLQMSDAAQRFTEGNANEGLLRACTAAMTWRQLALHDDRQIVQASAASNYIAASKLVAGMLAEQPLKGALPESCGPAFAAMADDTPVVCDAIKSQFHSRVAIAGQLKSTGSAMGPLLSNANTTAALLAPGYARFCTADADVGREADRIAAGSMWAACGVQGVLFDSQGCQTARITNPKYDYAAHMAQMRNMQSMSRLMGAVLAQRNRPTAAGAAIDSTGNNALPPGVAADAKQHLLRIVRLGFRGEAAGSFAVPMPASRLPGIKRIERGAIPQMH